MALAFQILLIAAVLLVIVAALAARVRHRRVARAGFAAIIVFPDRWLQGALLIASRVLAGRCSAGR
jgi:hypothetical protein